MPSEASTTSSADSPSSSLRRAAAAEYVDDRRQDPHQALTLALGQLDDARHDVAELAAHLTAAHNHLGHRLSED